MAEAVDVAAGCYWGKSISCQALPDDASGNAVVIGAGADGEMVFTRRPGSRLWRSITDTRQKAIERNHAFFHSPLASRRPLSKKPLVLFKVVYPDVAGHHAGVCLREPAKCVSPEAAGGHVLVVHLQDDVQGLQGKL